MSQPPGREPVNRPQAKTPAPIHSSPTTDTTDQDAIYDVPESGIPAYSSLEQTVGTLAASNKTSRSSQLLHLQRTHGNRFVQRLIGQLQQPSAAPDRRAHHRTIHRKEVKTDAEIQGTPDWTTADREGNAQRWKDANLANLKTADSSQYVKVVERRDFYKWFYEYSMEKKFTTRWALAAYVVANGAHQIADMDVKHETANDGLAMTNVELQGAMREGNQVIFDNVLPKLKKLIEGAPLTGQAALDWDKATLAEEQNLVQTMYAKMAPETIDKLNYIARKKRFAWLGAKITGEDKVKDESPNIEKGTVPGFGESDPNASLTNVNDRWKYGMDLGNKFTPGGTGYDPNKDKMPAVDANYQNGTEFTKVDNRHNLHLLDAWLNPMRVSRTGASSDIQAIINGLTAFEKQQVVTDKSPDGWAYSTQFAQFSFITEAMVTQALPTDAASAGAVSAFLAKYRTERAQVKAKYPDKPLMMGPKI